MVPIEGYSAASGEDSCQWGHWGSPYIEFTAKDMTANPKYVRVKACVVVSH